MQKKIIALAVAGLSTAAFAQTNVTIYGVADVSGQGSNLNQGSSQASKPVGGAFTLKNNSSLIGFKGTEDLGNGVNALFQIESNVNMTGNSSSQGVANDTTNSNFSSMRDSFVGVSSKYGTALGGYLSTPYRSALTSFDVMPGATGDGRIESLMSKQRFGANGSTTTTAQLQSSVRATAIAYAMPTLYGFNGSIAYTGSNNNGNSGNVVQTSTNSTTSNTAAIQGGLSMNLGWDGYGVGIKGAFQQVKAGPSLNSDATALASLSNYTSYLIGAQYTGVPGLKVAAVYNRNTSGWNNGTVNNVGAMKGSNNQVWVGASYRFGNNEPRISYANSSNTSGLNVAGLNQDGAKIWAANWGYYLSKRTQVYGIVSQITNNANGSFNMASGNSGLTLAGGEKVITYGAGLRTNF